MSVTAKALWYIESHLHSDLSLDEIADAVGISRFHLSRAFSASTGVSVAGYARARRLSQAAAALAEGAPDILAIAIDTGYGSHEAFTRAFRHHFDLTPEQLRAQASIANINLQKPLRKEHAMNTSQSALPLVKPRLVKHGALLLFGLSQRCERAGDPAIPSLWNRFVPHIGHIDGQVGNIVYGVVYNSGETGNYDYMCAVEVREFPAHPPEFTQLRVQPQTYAVFDHTGHVSAIGSTWRAIWEHGLRDADLEPVNAPALERHDERFDGRTGLGGLEIWVPVKA